MGLDIEYQAMPENCRLLERSRHEPGFGVNLEFFRSYALKLPKELAYRTDDQFTEFVEEARKTVKQHPAIEHRNLNLGRRWDMLYYLLSERRRKGEEQDWSHWVEKAVLGGQVLNQATQTTIGFPIRYLHPIEVLEVQNELEAIRIEMLRCHWNPQAMREVGVYKIRGDETEDCFEWIHEDFENFKAFYTLIAEHNEGVLAFIS